MIAVIAAAAAAVRKKKENIKKGASQDFKSKRKTLLEVIYSFLFASCEIAASDQAFLSFLSGKD